MKRRAKGRKRDPEARRRMAARVEAYRTATRETTPAHHWRAMVKETAIVRGVSVEMLKHPRIHQAITRAGNHGEPVWMIVDEVVFLAKQLPVAERSERNDLRNLFVRRRDPPRRRVADEPSDPKDLKAFAEAAKWAAKRADARFRFGRHKVFLAALEPNKVTRRLLVDAHRAGYLTLTRADLTPAMDPELVRRSEVGYMHATWHLIVVD